jgi:hypothetical protein
MLRAGRIEKIFDTYFIVSEFLRMSHCDSLLSFDAGAIGACLD